MFGKRALVGLLVICALAVAGCATYRIEPPTSDPLRDAYIEKTLVGKWWGNIADPEVFAADCGRVGINDVHFERTFTHSLLSMVSLGIYVPIRAKYRCRAPIPTPGSIR